ncbi:unnamed protein product, partial [Ascophyllum nodosum]
MDRTSPRERDGKRLRVDVPKPWSTKTSERTAARREKVARTAKRRRAQWPATVATSPAGTR